MRVYVASTLDNADEARAIAEARERFWSKVDRRGHGECWLWQASLGSHGYGQIKVGRRILASHRVAWILTNGAIGPGLFVCHRCDVQACCNPAHLFLGTHDDNMRDMHAKGRGWSPFGQSRGEAHHNAKLTAEAVARARAERAAGKSIAALAREHGVAKSTMGNALRGVTWA